MKIQCTPVKLVPFFLLFLIAACATTPLTQRRQLVLLPSSQLMQMSLSNYGEVKNNSKLSTDPREVEPVLRVGKRLADATMRYLKEQNLPTADYAWEFIVIKDDETVNAWCMPGGKIAVYTGILPITKDDTGLAVVMGHEIAHAIANHGNERMSQGMLAELGSVALAYAVKEQPEKTKDLFFQAYGAGTQIGLLLPYSRLHESEADRIGLTIMAMAGYDPNAAIPFWQRMNALSDSRPPEFLSTHPAPDSRIENIKQYLPEAMRHYQSRS
ncbi:MAG: M48 family peptidase [Candidatus Omnitrophota bacterium]|nr:MAG: M48 family peptidase [Candidatus Omnitrophota bacterium]